MPTSSCLSSVRPTTTPGRRFTCSGLLHGSGSISSGRTSSSGRELAKPPSGVTSPAPNRPALAGGAGAVVAGGGPREPPAGGAAPGAEQAGARGRRGRVRGRLRRPAVEGGQRVVLGDLPADVVEDRAGLVGGVARARVATPAAHRV